jgi:hypothetical protein
MNTLIKLSAGLLALSLAQASFAATDRWTQTSRAPNVYVDGADNSNFFSTPSSVPAAATITTVEWNIRPYTNGAFNQAYQICYAPRYSSAYTKCSDVTENRTGATHFFSGLSAKGSFKITGVLTGGTYPVYPTHSNSITVNYQY